MKGLKLSLVIMAAALVTFGLGGMAYAMHSGGTGYCEACHTMHNSLGGLPVAVRNGLVATKKGSPLSGSAGASVALTGKNYLLTGSDQSSTCLNCHANPGPLSGDGGIAIMTYPVQSGSAPYFRSPGGDFAWIAKSYGTGTQNPGYTHGHNINAIDYGLPIGTPLAITAPGGTYAQANLYCTSCHNPHSSTRLTGNPVASGTRVNSVTTTGAFTNPAPGPITGSGSSAGFNGAALPSTAAPLGVYRLLGDVGYVPLSYGSTSVAFAYPPPVAVAPSPYNQTEAINEVRVAYGSGMSQWCANCHLGIYNNVATGTSAPHIHPNGPAALLSANANISGTITTYANIYNAYISSGNLTGKQTASYTSLVPYEEGISDMSVLGSHATSTAPIYTTAGPGGTGSANQENVMCLSCHRAHASGFPQATRWYNNYQYITLTGGVWPGATAVSSSNYMLQADYSAAMYDHSASVFGTAGFQRPLCNKCHAKD